MRAGRFLYIGEGPQGLADKVISLTQWSDLDRGRGDDVRRSSPLVMEETVRQTLTRSSLSLGKSHKVSQADSDRLLLINT